MNEPKVYTATIENHPETDRLEFAVVGDYRAIVPRGRYHTGDRVAFLPAGATCPDWLIQEMDRDLPLIVGFLKGNRVQSRRIRGILSQGLVFPAEMLRGN